MVTTTMGMLHGVHGHTSNLGPAVALDLELVVGSAGLEEGLLGTPTAGDLADHGAAAAGDELLGPGGEFDPSDSGIRVLGHDDPVGSGGPGEAASVSSVPLDVAHDGSLGHGADGHHVTDGKAGLLARVNELARVHALGGDEGLLLVLVADGVLEGDPRKGSTASGVVDDVGDDTLDIPPLLRVVEPAELGGTLPGPGHGPEDASITFTLTANNATHLLLL
mmetsp:Transcript_6085/g.15487  ORF Transcript_6085/g.15487 Transcript_6085/m.15487 type:complete len:221 (-) Transcript_6085:62-724(-)